MRGIMLPALRVALVTWVMCGIAYPLAVTGLGQWLLPFQANGSLQKRPNGVILGSALIGQQWTGPEWFHGRPSGTTMTDPNDPAATINAPYNATNSGGSNLGPTSKRLAERISADRRVLEKGQPDLTGRSLPTDMLTASGSGLDPDISPADAALQVTRIAKARGLPSAEINALLEQHITGRDLGIFGERRANVLELNLTLDRLH
jgi:potassium-transporting ATPase KdpC subunit